MTGFGYFLVEYNGITMKPLIITMTSGWWYIKTLLLPLAEEELSEVIKYGKGERVVGVNSGTKEGREV